jgi:hypothetical protein
MLALERVTAEKLNAQLVILGHPLYIATLMAVGGNAWEWTTRTASSDLGRLATLSSCI